MLYFLRRTYSPVLSLPRSAKRTIVILVDISLCILTVWLSYYLRLGEFVSLSKNALWGVAISIAFAIPIFSSSGLYRAIFRYSDIRAMFIVFRAIMVYGLAYASLITAIGIPDIPRTIGLIQPLLMFFAVVGSRVFARFYLNAFDKSKVKIADLPKALVYGAGNAGRELVSALHNSNSMKFIGFLDDDKSLHGHIIHGQPIYSPEDLSELIESYKITHVILAIPSTSRRRRNEILTKLGKYHVIVRTLPSVSDLAEGRVTTTDMQDLDIDDLLGREPVVPNQELMAKNISTKVVLVTGAGGSIGSELCRQIIKLNPQKLLLVEMNEFALYSINSSLHTISNKLGCITPPVIVPLLVSVLDKSQMLEIMEIWKPNTIYHAAAYKHVPMVEYNIAQGLKNNIIGTLTTTMAAIEKGVSDFVLISTDKAVRPTNAMGASKRLSELCLQALFDVQENDNTHQKTKLSMVRFGNVLDSSGSVIPRFKKQIINGGPITLTHKEITRFFMTIPEAAQLVIQAGSMAKGGDVFVLDMGEPIKIAELARRMVELSGLSVKDENNPHADIEISITGLRPGEKLYEELLLGENPQPTNHSKIQRAQDNFIPWSQLENDLKALRELLNENRVRDVISLMQKLVVDYKPNSEIADLACKEKAKI